MYQHIEPAVAVDDGANRTTNRGCLCEVNREPLEIRTWEILLRDAARSPDNRNAGRQKPLRDEGAKAPFCPRDQHYSFAHSRQPVKPIALVRDSNRRCEKGVSTDSPVPPAASATNFAVLQAPPPVLHKLF